MSKITFLLLSLLCCLNVSAQELVVNHNTFFSPETGTYVETDILIIGNSIEYLETENGKLQGSVEITTVFRSDGAIVKADKYLLNSPEYVNTTETKSGIVDKKRYSLPNGVYVLDITYQDVNRKDSKAETHTESIIINHESDKIQLSDISLIDEYWQTSEKAVDPVYLKSGYYMTPLVMNFFPFELNRLSFYMEIYNADVEVGDDEFLVCYFVQDKQERLANDLFRFKKMKATAVNVLFNEFDIANLPTGDYDLVIEVKNQKNEVLAYKKQFFQRLNPIEAKSIEDYTSVAVENTFASKLTEEDVRFQLRSMEPIASVSEARTINALVTSADTIALKQFFYNFWVTRNANTPEAEWNVYAQKVKFVDAQYGTNQNEGFETDRGRIYLVYGPPNDLRDSPREPGADPYQIWHYYGATAANQSNVRFVFHNDDLVTNEYRLIHSTATNEVNNPNWQKEIHSSFTGGSSPVDDDPSYRNYSGSRSSQNFND